MSSESKPDILRIMGDFMPPEILAMVARCSKQALKSITPLLQMKLQNEEEMRQMVLRFYPSITRLPVDADLAYYKYMIHGRINRNIDDIRTIVQYVLTGYSDRFVEGCIHLTMRSPLGRREIIDALWFWHLISRGPSKLRRAMELKELVNRDMATRLMIRAKREAFCRRQNGLRNTLGDDSGALVPHLLPLPGDGAP
jgi:hypothetical protein